MYSETMHSDWLKLCWSHVLRHPIRMLYFREEIIVLDSSTKTIELKIRAISNLGNYYIPGSEYNRRPTHGGMSKTSKSSHGLADLDAAEDDEILKRMEEILLTYKARVETHLAAEGRELPKDIFEDFTTQWVATCKSPQASPPVSKSVSNGNLVMRREPSAAKLIVTPRKDPIQAAGEKRTRIPMPTFYSSPVPSETNIWEQSRTVATTTTAVKKVVQSDQILVKKRIKLKRIFIFHLPNLCFAQLWELVSSRENFSQKRIVPNSCSRKIIISWQRRL